MRKLFKKGFTFIEVIIALSLFGALLFSLLTFYKSLGKDYLKLEKSSEYLLKRHSCIARLQQIFLQLVKEDREGSKKVFFTSPGEKLFLTWNNGVHLDAKLSGIVSGVLQCKKDMLVISYYEDEKEITQERLLEGVSHIEMKFYHSKKGWETGWDHEELPSMVKLLLTDHSTKKSWEVPFFLHDQPIIYKEESP